MRARLARALVRLGGARCVLPQRYVEGLRDRGRRHAEVGRGTRRRARRAGVRRRKCRLERRRRGKSEEPGRHHRRGRPQWAHHGLLSGTFGAQSAGARTSAVHRRRRGEPAPVRGLHVLQLLLRVQPAQAGNHTRPGIAQVRPAGHSLRGRLHHDAGRRPPGPVRQSRRAAPRNRPPFEARRGSLRPLLARRDAPVQVHQAAADARAAGSHLVANRATCRNCCTSAGDFTGWARSACTTPCASGP